LFRMFSRPDILWHCPRQVCDLRGKKPLRAFRIVSAMTEE
jgi:hypothetical protein